LKGVFKKRLQIVIRQHFCKLWLRICRKFHQ